jgi:hypothetical protein
VIGVSLLVPAVLIPYDSYSDSHTTSTVGGPLTLGFCVALAVGFDLVLWMCVGLFLVARSMRKTAGDPRESRSTRI